MSSRPGPHRWTRETARRAAVKGGEATAARYGQAHYKAAGRLGGLRSAAARAAQRAKEGR